MFQSSQDCELNSDWRNGTPVRPAPVNSGASSEDILWRRRSKGRQSVATPMESKITRNKQVLAEAGSQPWLEAVCVCLFPPYWRTKLPLLPSLGTQAALPLASLLPINPVRREKRIERTWSHDAGPWVGDDQRRPSQSERWRPRNRGRSQGRPAQERHADGGGERGGHPAPPAAPGPPGGTTDPHAPTAPTTAPTAPPTTTTTAAAASSRAAAVERRTEVAAGQ
ncbi:uncharacterized protein LOC132471079 isoform X3 [Gadus macrocephalus]|uniref:uncharacterized protein LOC132471079 isoform X3 n=1 Tax=Gadus macrocephalus TaxID=80720 RepID=UPI0028CBACAE|nr:uncharacterized protein LOC132471079 isoform X3 [Gadus macrocephalus]